MDLQKNVISGKHSSFEYKACNFDKEVSFLKRKIEQLEKEKSNLYARCLENEEAMYEAVIKGNDNHLIELVNKSL